MNKPYKIWQHIYQVGGVEMSDPDDCNVYLLDDGDLWLIDCGIGRSFNKLIANIKGLGFNPKKLKGILITHSHIDHIGSISQFQKDYQVQVIAHELDADAIEQGIGTGAEDFGVSYIPCRLDTRIRNSKQSLLLSHHEVNIIHIPGHTPGSIAIYVDIDGKRILFGQDIHCPFLPERGADPSNGKESLQKLVNLKADILCAGHFEIYQPAEIVEDYIKSYL